MMTATKTSTRWSDDIEERLGAEVDRLFRGAVEPMGEPRENPVTGWRYISGYDPIEPQKEIAHRALRARAWFAENAPADAPQLPLSRAERAKLERGGLPHLVAWYAESLASDCRYKYWEHPSFEDYARGVLASPYCHEHIKQDSQLRERFPPKPLHGLGPGRIWVPDEPNNWKPAPFSRRQRDGIS
jgi:hypothetical protein